MHKQSTMYEQQKKNLSHDHTQHSQTITMIRKIRKALI